MIMRVRFVITGVAGLPGVQTTYWNGASSVPVTADSTDVVGRVQAFWNSFKGFLASGTTVVGPQAVDIINPLDGSLTGQLSPGAVSSIGGTGTSSMASATMMLLKYNTAVIVNGRKLQGRNFIGPVGTNTNNVGDVASAANAGLLTAAAFLNSGATASVLCVWHRPKGTPPAGGLASPVTGYGTSTEYAVLRSRRD